MFMMINEYTREREEHEQEDLDKLLKGVRIFFTLQEHFTSIGEQCSKYFQLRRITYKNKCFFQDPKLR